MTLESLLADAYRYALSLCSKAVLAEDLVQEAWLRVVERYGSDFSKPLLYRTIRNLYVDRWRHESRFPTETFDENLAVAAPSGFSHDPALEAALRTLGDVERETLFLSVIEGYSSSEIASLTECPRGSVLSRLHRAKQKLAALLDDASVESGQTASADARVAVFRPRSVRRNSRSGGGS